MEYYKFPLKISLLLQEGGTSLPKCSEKESIDQHLGLLFTTCPGEHRHDPRFGCRIWDMDFEKMASQKSWQDHFAACLAESIAACEPRLGEVEVLVTLSDTTYMDKLAGTASIKKKADVLVKAVLNSTQEKCRFRYRLFLGPLASE